VAAVWATSVVFARVVSSAFFFKARASLFAIAASFAFPVAIPFAVTPIWAFPVAVRVALAVLSLSPATVSFSIPIPVPTITSFAVAMVLARGAMTFRVAMMVMRTFCKRKRRKEVSTVLDSCLLVEGAPVDWQ